MRRVGALVVALAIFAGSATPAGASPTTWDAAAASRFFDARARTAYDRGDFDLALDYFLLEHETAPIASSAFNVATAAEVAERFELAYAFYQTYLSLAAADDSNRGTATQAVRRLEARLALVEITSDPPGAQVYVDTRDHGRFATTPCVVAVEPGQRTIFLSRQGHADAQASVVAVRGRKTPLAVPLTELRSQLRVLEAPSGAQVTIERNGTTLATFAANTEATVPSGEFRVVVRCDGYAPFERDVRVSEAAVREVRVDMQRLPPVLGRLLASTGDVVARLRIDGVDRTDTPATLRIPIGTHTVELHADGYETFTTTVEIRESESTLIEQRLVRARN